MGLELEYRIAEELNGLFGDDIDDFTFRQMVDDEAARRRANA